MVKEIDLLAHPGRNRDAGNPGSHVDWDHVVQTFHNETCNSDLAISPIAQLIPREWTMLIGRFAGESARNHNRETLDLLDASHPNFHEHPP